MASMTFEIYQTHDFDSLLEMNQKLYPNMDRQVLLKMLREITPAENYRILMAKDEKGVNVGFAMVSIRTDYVEGATSSPTGYLEAIYVEPEFRKTGVGKKLVEMGEDWCKEKGCKQMGSDTWLNHEKARAFHRKLGFWEEDELVHFLKNLS